ncbi:ABC-type transporter, integral membrane subunit [Desulfofundulus kuznetsovii DSM 6115]|uniref:ABC-type transporter, integral membrane subunit n=1 Tax=Desulfofundulus kuznetsovii (strain DSM 6115 / VKM B-1805 / 17) TaxID=760568 RepID=A0AAU8PCB1_DESK7|nr:ABC-type transporter, integral membrane subunit [Desulfofundulus kuznetsovii DSM 6115]
MSLSIWLGSLEQGLLWGAMVLGVYMTFRVLDYPDLTVDGAFTLGAAVTAQYILLGNSPWQAVLGAIICGALAGLVTGLLHTGLRVAPLLSGILTMIALYSINLRIMGQANLSLLREQTIFTQVRDMTLLGPWGPVLLGLMVVIVVVGLLYLFLQTELGMSVRATGDNEQMIRSLGVNTSTMKLVGLTIGNALVALSGSLVAQYQGFADIGMGIGMIIAGLASVIIGEALVGNHTLFRALLAVIVGSIVYRTVISLVLQLGMPATDLKLLTSLIVVAALAFPLVRQRLGFRSLRLRSEQVAETGQCAQDLSSRRS